RGFGNGGIEGLEVACDLTPLFFFDQLSFQHISFLLRRQNYCCPKAPKRRTHVESTFIVKLSIVKTARILHTYDLEKNDTTFSFDQFISVAQVRGRPLRHDPP